jgi:hypothetical protein
MGIKELSGWRQGFSGRPQESPLLYNGFAGSIGEDGVWKIFVF